MGRYARTDPITVGPTTHTFTWSGPHSEIKMFPPELKRYVAEWFRDAGLKENCVLACLHVNGHHFTPSEEGHVRAVAPHPDVAQGAAVIKVQMPKGTKADSRHKVFQFSVRSETPDGLSAGEIFATLSCHESKLRGEELEDEVCTPEQDDAASPEIVWQQDDAGDEGEGEPEPESDPEPEPESPYVPVAFGVLNALTPWKVKDENDVFFSQNHLRHAVSAELPVHGMSQTPARIDATINYLREKQYIRPVECLKRKFVVTKRGLGFLHLHPIAEDTLEGEKYSQLRASRREMGQGLRTIMLSLMDGKTRKYALLLEDMLERRKELEAEKTRLVEQQAETQSALNRVEEGLAKQEEEARRLRIEYAPYLGVKEEVEEALEEAA